MKTLNIPFKGEVLIIKVDDDIYEFFCDKKLYVIRAAREGTNNGYYFRFRENGKYIYLHRYILGVLNQGIMQVDHINGDTLNNTRENLRAVDYRQNMYNRRKPINSSRRYKGVIKAGGKYKVEIKKDGIIYMAAYFDTEHLAAMKYNELATYLFGEYASLNSVN